MIKKLIIGSVLLACLGLCIFTGCLSSSDTQQVVKPREVIQNYSSLVSNWNYEVRELELSDRYKLSNDNNSAVVSKLNNLFNNTNDEKKFNAKYKCILDKHKMIYMPSNEYSQFLKENSIKHASHFTKDDKEDHIIGELKRVLKSKVIDADMLKKIAYLNDFKKYFEDKKSSFYENGFSESIKDYDSYMKLVNEFNSGCK